MHVTMIFLQEQERIVMISFVLPKGLVGYFPQEVFSSHSWTPGVDIYALGMTLMHFITQRRPFLFDSSIHY